MDTAGEGERIKESSADNIHCRACNSYMGGRRVTRELKAQLAMTEGRDGVWEVGSVWVYVYTYS